MTHPSATAVQERVRAGGAGDGRGDGADGG